MKNFFFTIVVAFVLGGCSSTDEVIDTSASEVQEVDTTNIVEKELQDTVPRIKITKTPTHYSVSKPPRSTAKKKNM